jgi:hypothetical protein
MKPNYTMRNLRMKDQAPRQRMLDEHDAHWAQEEKRLIQGKIVFACLLTVLLLGLLAIYMPVEANTNAWQAISDMSLVDIWGEE